MSVNNTENPVAVITGSARRVGAAIACKLHDCGFNLILHYRHSKQEALALKDKLEAIRPESVKTIAADLNNIDALANFASSIKKAFGGRVDALINNASMFYPTKIATATLTDWDDLMASNLKAPFFLSQLLLDELQKSQGCIINISDIYAERPKLNHSIYCMAKAANNMMTKSLALELAPQVRVNAIAPGAALWPENNKQEQVNTKALETIPLNKLGGSEPLANTVKFLLMDAPYITGQIINVDGGKSLLQP